MNRWIAASSLLIMTVGCNSAPPRQAAPTIHYVGSSTIANFMRDAEGTYGRASFTIDSDPESAGGEQSILEGTTDIAGVARAPRPETLKAGVEATLIGHDAIAVVVHPSNPVGNLTRAELKRVFTGVVRNWKDLGGPDLPIKSFIVSSASATRNVFRSAVLGEADYGSCETVQPDRDIVMKVEGDPGAIGQVSFSFLGACGHVKPIQVDGQPASPSNAQYPIIRPLYLLWWKGRARVADFVTWTIESPDAQGLLARRFATPARVTRQ